jgi:hypothetical protein
MLLKYVAKKSEEEKLQARTVNEEGKKLIVPGLSI